MVRAMHSEVHELDYSIRSQGLVPFVGGAGTLRGYEHAAGRGRGHRLLLLLPRMSQQHQQQNMLRLGVWVKLLQQPQMIRQ